jgi:sterol desaturase/sphingolipid hydroxylase (fatty acid hydroxylase superfamily)
MKAVLGVFVALALGSMALLVSPPLYALYASLVGDMRLHLVEVLIGLPAWTIFFGFLARFRPRDPDQKPVHAGFATDATYWFMTPVVLLASRLVGTLGLAALAWAVGLQLGPELRLGFGPIAQQPRWLIAVEMVVLIDLLAYSIHRAMHTFPWLWRVHAIHHSARQLDWMSAVRIHPLNDVIMFCGTTLTVAALGFPLDLILQVYPFVALYAVIIHSNLNITLRPLSYVLTSPVYHAFHHTHSDEGGNKNFAGLFPIFDKLFGTYYLPHYTPMKFGLDDHDFPTDVPGQLMYPFRRETSAATASTPAPQSRLVDAATVRTQPEAAAPTSGT